MKSEVYVDTIVAIGAAIVADAGAMRCIPDHEALRRCQN
jgi:hypothetical protein